MAIHRSPHNPTQVLLRDDLTWRAKGLYTYLATHTNQFFPVDDIPGERAEVDQALAELLNRRLIHRHDNIDGGGNVQASVVTLAR